MNDQMLLDLLQVFCPKALPDVRSAIDADDYLRYREALETLLNHLIEHDKALQSLTPGGSEYVNDRERCLAVARERFARGDEWRQWSPRVVTSIQRHDPCGTAWRQSDGRLVLELDHTGKMINLPTEANP